jgi:DNA-binding PadR family transcriptional regulator
MYAEIVILAMLRQRPQHGYEIKKSIEQVFGGTVALNNTILYPTLKRFEEMGAVVREVVQQEGKPNRHLYHLTERGSELLHTLLCDFPAEQVGNEAEFFTRVAFFEFLDPQERQAILSKRLAYLQGGLDYLQHLQEMACIGYLGHPFKNKPFKTEKVLHSCLQIQAGRCRIRRRQQQTHA